MRIFSLFTLIIALGASVPVPAKSDELVDYHLQRVLAVWLHNAPNSAIGPGERLAQIWYERHASPFAKVRTPFEISGVGELLNSVRSDSFFRECPEALALSKFEFLAPSKGTPRIDTVGDLTQRLEACSPLL